MSSFKELPALKKLTETLSQFRPTPLPFSELTKESEEQSSVIKIDAGDGGDIAMIGLMKKREVAVSHGIIKEGSTMAEHSLEYYEYFIVFKGVMTLELQGRYIEVCENDIFYVEPNVSHAASWPKDTELICITIPASAEFPEVKNG